MTEAGPRTCAEDHDRDPRNPTRPTRVVVGCGRLDTLWALAMVGIAAVLWFDHLLRQAGRPDLVQLTPDTAPGVLAIVSAATVGAVLAGRRPRHPVGWLLLALGCR